MKINLITSLVTNHILFKFGDKCKFLEPILRILYLKYSENFPDLEMMSEY